MTVTLQETKNIAKVAHLKLTTEEVSRFKDGLEDLLKEAEKLKKVDTDHVPPSSLTNGLVNVYRDDVVAESLPLEEALSTGKRNGNYFEVDAIFE